MEAHALSSAAALGKMVRHDKACTNITINELSDSIISSANNNAVTVRHGAIVISYQ